MPTLFAIGRVCSLLRLASRSATLSRVIRGNSRYWIRKQGCVWRFHKQSDSMIPLLLGLPVLQADFAGRSMRDCQRFSSSKRRRLSYCVTSMYWRTAYTTESRRLRAACPARTDFCPGNFLVLNDAFRLCHSFPERFCFLLDVIQRGSLYRIGEQDRWIVLCLICDRSAKVGVYVGFTCNKFFDCGLVGLLFLLPRV